MDMSQTPANTEAETTHHTVDPKAERRAEIIGFGIVGGLIAALGVAYLAMGLDRCRPGRCRAGAGDLHLAGLDGGR